MDHGSTFILLAAVLGFFMAWGIGANDVANAMGTSVGSKALTFLKATIIAAIFEAGGAILAGGQVTNTIRNDIINPALLAQTPNLLIYGMLASLLAAGVWLLYATYKGLPVSTTHTIVGAIVGFAAINLGTHVIHWHVVTNIVLSWILTPFIAGLIAYMIFVSIQHLIFNTDNPFKNAKKFLPFYAALLAFIVSMVTLREGLAHVNFIHFDFQQDVFIALGLSVIATLLVRFCIRNIEADPSKDKVFMFASVERVFAFLQICSACAVAFAHGSNDVANAIGPLASVISTVKYGAVISNVALEPWVLYLGAAGIVLGLATMGYKVIATVGTHITELTPSRGFAAELSTAATVVLASGFGLPVSTTQTLVGAILGVGFARGIAALNMQTIRSIFMSWVITLPAGAILAVILFTIIRWIFGG